MVSSLGVVTFPVRFYRPRVTFPVNSGQLLCGLAVVGESGVDERLVERLAADGAEATSTWGIRYLRYLRYFAGQKRVRGSG